ncbi:hypothetical protein SELR_07210 [Selenomonas ruminantium subsp. lactilytica TAM6421]|uniref:Uncharacterized protein n=1 Tax=Selenomonas ruminantium subsp. lactilytica (strain NBRC 103574 / TAM6421) TaxID=927704 RepID=I0GNU2_SELRL|nr:hypothetical protein [Selenomonas ruminantium]BAL82429.1 hypothetical protein SELR_07210 [Selenomonas ruminantium subsp. lactilytica TAM6421]
MIKRILVAFAVVAALVFSGAAGTDTDAEAAHVYVGTYSDGTDAYLVTESVYVKSRSPYTFNCTIVYSGVSLHYSFYPVNGSPYYRNSEGYEGYVFGGQSPVASNIYQYVVNHW